MRSSSSQSCQTLDIFNFFGLLTRQSIDADQVGGRIFSRHGRTNFLGLHGNLSIPIIYSGAGFHRGGMRAENIFSPPPLTASTVIRRPVVSYMVNNLCGRRMSTTIAMELYDETNKHCCDQVSSVPHIRLQGSAHDSSQVTPLPKMRN